MPVFELVWDENMSTWEAIILGVIQGLTEFLPVSSSGHLELGQIFLGFNNLHHYIFFNLICHMGTLCAIFYLLFPQIKQSLTTHKERLGYLVLATLPLFPLVFVLKPIKAVFDQPQYLGLCFLFTALLLFSSQMDIKRRSKSRKFDSITIGCFQALAVFPGISRSGSTISAARLLGWSNEEAVSFSFLLAIPAILGGTALELLQLFMHSNVEGPSIHLLTFAVGFITSFAVGCLALKLLIRMLAEGKWIYFAWYCLFLGIVTTVYFNFLG